MTPARLHIGTSGWSYPHWKGPFYPAGAHDDALLELYADRLRTVEINSSFYGTPARETLLSWRDAVPRGFVFAVKANRFITHMKKLREPARTLRPFLESVAVLGERLGPILFQLPPHWHFDEMRLSGFLDALPGGYRYAFEFRDQSWWNPRTLRRLEEHEAAWCIFDLDGRLSPRKLTTDFVYVRLHGPDGPYRGRYDRQTLAGWAGAFSTWLRQGREIYCYFDNDDRGYAVLNACELASMLRGKRRARP